MTEERPSLCGDDRIQEIVSQATEDAQAGLAAAERALAEFPEDARLCFLAGSLMIELRRFIEAHAAFTQAIKLAPDFHLARFQLGFFELTSGEADAARTSWAPLRQSLQHDHHLVRFVEGLEALIADRLGDCIDALREGIDANAENPALNRDMELIIEKCEELMMRHSEPATDDPSNEVSATSFLLGTGRQGGQ